METEEKYRTVDAQQQIKQYKMRLAALNAISKTVISHLNIDELLNITMNKILETRESDSVRIYLLDDGEKVLNLVVHKGLSAGFINDSFIKSRKSGNCVLWQTLLDGETKVVNHTQKSTASHVNLLVEEGLQSTAYVPLITKGTSMGVICVSSRTLYNFSTEFVEFLTAIGNHIGIALNNANLYKIIKEAYQDLKEAQEQVVWTGKLASLGKLAATIAHEINNPLAGVLNYVRLILKMLARNHFSHEKLEDVSQYLKLVESEITRCSEIVKTFWHSPVVLKLQLRVTVLKALSTKP